MATDTLCSHPITRFGILVDSDTDERLRPATKAEHLLLTRFSERHPSALAPAGAPRPVPRRRCPMRGVTPAQSPSPGRALLVSP